jgi:glycosyltransferase involved in cell wall biosynthesis
LNEAETLERCIVKAKTFITKNSLEGEVIIGDNGSTDGSQEIAIRNGAIVVNVPSKGYGSALIGGITAANGKYIIMGDSDDSYDFSDLMPFIDEIRKDNDVVMGNRFKGGIQKDAMPPLHYWLGNPVLSFIGRLFFNSKIGDFHCGIRCFTKEAFLKMDLQTTGMEFATEMIVKAELLGMKISEVPVKLYPDGRSRPPHLRTWRDGWRHLRFMLLYSPAWLFLYPGLILALFGLSVGSILIFTPIKIGTIELDINTLIYMGVFILTGAQSVFFYLLSKIYAIREKLLPGDIHHERFLQVFGLEAWLLAGLSFIVLGVIGSIYAIGYWSDFKFGNLDPRHALRIIIPSIISILLGVQIFLSGFFLGILGLKKKN